MAKHMVRNVSKVDYMHMTDDEIRKVYHLGDLKFEYECTCFDMDGDEYVCYRDMEGDSDDRGYAVYLKSSGHLLCLLADAGSALGGYEDWEYGEKRNELYRQIAMLAGWPEHASELKVTLTWRQLVAKLGEFPREFMDTQAYVCVDDDNLEYVADVLPWFQDGKYAKDNCLYIDLLRNGNEE